jgi:CHAT domain-containing protein/tetratricopeptide (TPR) repeat protein
VPKFIFLYSNIVRNILIKFTFLIVFSCFTIHTNSQGQKISTNHFSELTGYAMKTDSFYKISKYDSALVYLKKVDTLDLTDFIQDSSKAQKLYMNFSYCYYALGDYDKAIFICKKSYIIARKIYELDSYDVAIIRAQLGSFLMLKNQLDESLNYQLLSLKFFEKDTSLKFVLPYLAILNNVAITCARLGDFRKALELNNKNLSILKTLSFTDSAMQKEIKYRKVIAYTNIGELYGHISLFEESLENLLHAYSLCDTSDPTFIRNQPFMLYRNLGITYKMLEDYDNALKYYLMAYNINKKYYSDNNIPILDIICELSDIYSTKGKNEQAFEFLKQGKQIIEQPEIYETIESSNLNLNIGKYHFLNKDYRQALKYYNIANNIFEKVFLIDQDNSWSQTYMHLMGATYLELGIVDSACYYYDRAYFISKEIPDKLNISFASFLYDYAKICYQISEFKKTESVLEEAIDIITEYQNVIPHTEGIYSPFLKLKSDVYKLLFLNSLMLGNENSIIGKLENTRSVELLKESKDKRYIFEMSDSLCKQKYKYFKESIFLNKLLLKLAEKNDKLEDVAKLTLENKKLNDSLSQLKLAIIGIKVKANDINETDSFYFSIKKQLKDNQIIVCYTSFQDSLWISLITNKGYETKKVLFKETLSEKIDNYMALLSSNYKGIYKLEQNTKQYYCTKDQLIKKLGAKGFAKFIFDGNEPLSQEINTVLLDSLSCFFYEKLIAPIENTIANFNELIIIPDQGLDILPFTSLYSKENSSRQYLVEKFDVHYTNSLSILLDKNLREIYYRKASKKDLLAIAISNYKLLSVNNNSLNDKTGILTAIHDSLSNSRFGLNNLMYTKLELESIVNAYKPSLYKILYDSLATESEINLLNNNNSLSDYKMIHIATHGCLKDIEIFGGSLAMYDSKLTGPDLEIGNDGYLAFFEIMKLNLQSDLVVLSACNSGIGKYLEGEGVCGLNYAFYLAGANNIISSLWEIDDRFTAAYFAEFYSRIKAGETYSAALNNISRIIIQYNKKHETDINICSKSFKEALHSKDYFPPFYWAAFSLW